MLIVMTLASANVPKVQAEAVANAFGTASVRGGGFSLFEFKGKVRQVFVPLLSRRLLRHLDSARDCEQEWIRRQPKGSTDKPPFVDCCVFGDSADWFPNSFTILGSEVLPDGRRQVAIQYRYRSGTVDSKWRVAVIVTKENSRYVVDDFVGGLSDSPPDPYRLSNAYTQCRDGEVR